MSYVAGVGMEIGWGRWCVEHYDKPHSTPALQAHKVCTSKNISTRISCFKNAAEKFCSETIALMRPLLGAENYLCASHARMVLEHGTSQASSLDNFTVTCGKRSILMRDYQSFSILSAN